MNTTAAFVKTASTGTRPDTISQIDFLAIAEFVRARSGIVLGLDKAYLVESRLEQIVRNRRFGGFADLTARLRSHPNEALANDIVEAMTTNCRSCMPLFPRRSRCGSGRPRRHPGKSAIPLP